MIRLIAKIFAVTVALTAFLNVASVSAAPVEWISNTGVDGNGCTAINPCASIDGAITVLDSGGQINCLNSPRSIGTFSIGGTGTSSATIDCAGVWETTGGTITLSLNAANLIWKIRNLTFSGATGGLSA